MCPFGHTVPHHSNLHPSPSLSPPLSGPSCTHTHTENMCHTHTPACPPYQSHHLCKLTRSNTQSWSFMQTESSLKAQTHRPNTVAERLQVYKPLLFIDLYLPLYKIIIFCLIVFLCVSLIKCHTCQLSLTSLQRHTVHPIVEMCNHFKAFIKNLLT